MERRTSFSVALMLMIWTLALQGVTRASEEKPVSLEAIMEELTNLRIAVQNQQRQIESLQSLLDSPPAGAVPTPQAGTQSAPAANVAPATVQNVSANQDDLVKRVETLSANLGGFKFSGDFRLRADVQARSGNAIAGPLQNIRGRYRIRLNMDKDIDPRFRFHLQLSTGPYNNETTNDQDLAGLAVKQPFSVAEGWVDYHPTLRVSLRGGRMEEVFADNTRFLWDDDVRLNGFQQVATIPIQSRGALKTIEFRSGEYLLTNPNIPILAANSPFVTAGYTPGQKVRAANLFHPGVIISGDLSSRWTHQLLTDIQLYRNQNQIALAATASGFPVVVNNSVGLTLSGPVTAVGNATTTPGGAIYTASRFQIARVAYRLTNRGLKIGNREMPFFIDLQAARNVGTHQLRDAMMLSLNLGNVRRFGDMRFLYQFSIKDANSLIAQFTDDDLGTGVTTNIAVHAIRYDLGLTRSLQWQNLFFIQNARRPNNPVQQFFVPLRQGANPTYRYLGQLAFTF